METTEAYVAASNIEPQLAQNGLNTAAQRVSQLEGMPLEQGASAAPQQAWLTALDWAAIVGISQGAGAGFAASHSATTGA